MLLINNIYFTIGIHDRLVSVIVLAKSFVNVIEKLKLLKKKMIRIKNAKKNFRN